MPIRFTSPTFARPGVVAGFTLEAPLSGTPASGPVTFTFYSTNVSLPVTLPWGSSSRQSLTIATGFVHWIEIGDLTYSYSQLSTDTPTSIALALANLINEKQDPNAVATASGSTVTLAPRQDSDAAVYCGASESWYSQGVPLESLLVELTGNNRIPTLTRGVLFAQGEMYAPLVAPSLPAAPASRESWLFYSSTAGFYWSATSTPTVSDDALIGWVETNSAQIVAFSSRRIGSGEEAVVQTLVQAQLIGAGAGGDTGVPPALTFGANVAPNAGQLVISDLTFASTDNVDGVTSGTFLIYSIDQTVTPLSLAAPGLTAAGTSIVANAALPSPGPASPVFTFLNSGVVGGVTIGVGYEHNIAIGATVYQYAQQTGDTAAAVAAALAALINASADPNATAAASGATVTLAPLRDDGSVVPCTASDGNSPASLTEQVPTFLLIGNPTGPGLNCEIVQITASSGVNGTIIRGQKGTTAQAWPAGTDAWPITEATSFFALPGPAYGTSGWPTALAPIPMGTKSLVAIDGWATNEYGNSVITTLLLFVAPSGGGSGTVALAAQVSGLAALNTGGYVNGIYYSMSASGQLCASVGVAWTASTDPNWASEEIFCNLDGTHFGPLGSAGANTFVSAPFPCPVSGNYTVQAVSVNTAGVMNPASIPTVTVNVNTSLAALVCLLPTTVGVTRTIEGITPGAPNAGTYNPSQQTVAYSVAATFPADPNRAAASVIFGVFNSNFQTLTPGPGTQGYFTSGPCVGWADFASLGSIGINALAFTPHPQPLGPSLSYLAFTVVPCNWGDQYPVMPAMPSFSAAFGASSFSYAMVNINGAVVTPLSGPGFSAAMNGRSYLLNGYQVTVAANGYNSGNGTVTLTAAPGAGNLSNLSTGIPLQDIGLITLLVAPAAAPLPPTTVNVARTIEGITANVLATNAPTSSGSAVLNFATSTNLLDLIAPGQTATGTGIAAGSVVTAVTLTTVTLSIATTGVANAASITFAAPGVGSYAALQRSVYYNVNATFPTDPNRDDAAVLFSVWNSTFQVLTPGPSSQGYIAGGPWAGWGIFSFEGAAGIASPTFVCAPQALSLSQNVYMAFTVTPTDWNGNYSTSQPMPSYTAPFSAISFSFATVSAVGSTVTASGGAAFAGPYTGGSPMIGRTYLINGQPVVVAAVAGPTSLTLVAPPTTSNGMTTNIPFQDVGLITLLAYPLAGRVMTENSVVAGTLTTASLSPTAGITGGQLAAQTVGGANMAPSFADGVTLQILANQLSILAVAPTLLTGAGTAAFTGSTKFAGSDGSYMQLPGTGLVIANAGGAQKLTLNASGAQLLGNGATGPQALLTASALYLAQAWNTGGYPAGPAFVATATGLTIANSWYSSGIPATSALNLTPTGLTLAQSWNSSGQCTSSYCTITAAGLTLSDYSAVTTARLTTNSLILQSAGATGPTAALLASGLFIAAGWNASGYPVGPAASLTTSALVMSSAWNSSGVATGPYTQINSSGVNLYYSATSQLAIASTGLTLTGPSGSLALNSSGIVITNGSYSLTVGASQVQLAYSTASTLTLTSSSLALLAGGVTLTIASTGITAPNLSVESTTGYMGPSTGQVTYGEYYTTLTASDAVVQVAAYGYGLSFEGVTISANQNSAITMSLTGITSPVTTKIPGQIQFIAGYNTAAGASLESLSPYQALLGYNANAITLTPNAAYLGAPAASFVTTAPTTASPTLTFTSAGLIYGAFTQSASASGNILYFGTASYGLITAGMYVYGTNVPAATSVLSVYYNGSAICVVMSAAVTSTGVASGAGINFSAIQIGSVAQGAGITSLVTVTAVGANSVTLSGNVTVASGVPITFAPWGVLNNKIVLTGVIQPLATQPAGTVAGTMATFPAGTTSAPYEYERCIATDGTHCVRPMWATSAW